MASEPKRIETLAIRAVQAKAEVNRLRRERNACRCELAEPGDDHGPGAGDGYFPPPAEQEHPCWKHWIHIVPTVFESTPDEGEIFGTRRVTETITEAHIDEFFEEHACEPCQRRRQLHADLVRAQRRYAGLWSGLTRAVGALEADDADPT